MANPPSTRRTARRSINNLLAAGLLDENPNATQPFRLDRTQSNTCDQNHNYLTEQEAVDHGLLDNYVAATGSGNSGLQTASTLWSGTGPAPAITVGAPLLPGQYNKNVVTGGNATTGPFSYSGYCFDGGNGKTANKGIVMGYYDGNTVTAMWNYAQNFAMSDNSWSTTLGPPLRAPSTSSREPPRAPPCCRSAPTGLTPAPPASSGVARQLPRAALSRAL